MASVFVLVILAISLWNEAYAAPATQLIESENLHSPRNLIQNGVGITPPMGWDSWYHFYCEVNETIINSTVASLISSGLSAVGYEYIIIDDCWGNPDRDAQGNLMSSPTKFPNGIKPVADYIHQHGLKLGLYAESGYLSCTNTTAGSLGHEQSDAQTFASWGVDYVKYDNCHTDGSSAQSRFTTMSKALNQTGRQIFFAVCDWGASNPATWAPLIANSWRTAFNIDNSWGDILNNAELNDQWAHYAGTGRWNDPDTLQVGNGNLSIEEYRAQFSLWALMKAPLMISADLTTLTDDSLLILNNTEVIAVNKDPLAIQGSKVSVYGDLEVWAGPLVNLRTVVVLLNRGNTSATVTAQWEDIGLAGDTVVQARDIWQDLDGVVQGNLTYEGLGPGACKMYILEPVKKT